MLSHSELTTEELWHLQEQQQQEMAEELSSEEEEMREDVSSSVINEICAKWTEVQISVEKFHPNKAVTNRATSIFNDNVMDHFRRIVQQRKNQLTMDRFLMKEKRKASSEPDSPPKTRDRRETTPEGRLPTLFMEGDSSSKQEPPPSILSTSIPVSHHTSLQTYVNCTKGVYIKVLLFLKNL